MLDKTQIVKRLEICQLGSNSFHFYFRKRDKAERDLKNKEMQNIEAIKEDYLKMGPKNYCLGCSLREIIKFKIMSKENNREEEHLALTKLQNNKN